MYTTVSESSICPSVFFSIQGSLTYLVRPWWSSTALSVWMCTRQSRPGTITPTELILALASPTCCSWCIPSTGQRGLPTSLCPGLSYLFIWQPLAALPKLIVWYRKKWFIFIIVSQYCHSPLAGFMVSRFIQWLTSYSCRQPPASRVPSKRSAKNLSRAG